MTQTHDSFARDAATGAILSSALGQAYGTPTTAHSAIQATATSDEIDMEGYGFADIEVASADADAKWTIEVLVSPLVGGNKGPLYVMNGAAAVAVSFTVDFAVVTDNQVTYRVPVSRFIAIRATEVVADTSGMTCKVTPVQPS